MYVSCDHHSPELGQHIAQALTQCQALHPTARAYALIDACLDSEWAHELWQRSQDQPQQVQALYQNTPLARFEECSPFVCTLAGDELAGLLARTGSWPMLSVIQSSLSLDELRTHLARFASVRTADGLRFPARWGFPLAVPLLIEALSPPDRALLLGGFHAWHLINRTGTLETAAGEPAMQPPGSVSDKGGGMAEPSVEIGEDAFARLVDAAEVDALLVDLVEPAPSLRRGRRGSELHALGQSVLAAMDHLGLEGATLRRQRLGEVLATCDSEQDALAYLAAHVATR